MKPEEKAEIILWDWLMNKGKFVKEVYFNRKNEWNGVFSVKGTHGRKPDLVVKIDKGFGLDYIAVEVKSSKRGKDVYDACKILDYYEEYFSGKAKYFIEKEEIKIAHFAIATDNSIIGHLLYDEEKMFDNYKDSDNPEFKKQLVDAGCYPQLEFYATGLYLRILWANWRRLAKRCCNNKVWTGTKAPSIGIFMTELRNDLREPYFFTMVFCDWLDKKSSWGQRFWKL